MTADIAIVDYGMGNLRSVQKALEAVGARADIVSDPSGLDAPGMLLPGVGAFRDAMDNLRRLGLVEPIRRHIEAGRPFLGVCLGLHLLFDVGEEFGVHQGLGVVPGRVVRFAPGKKVPHMGWNTLKIRQPGGILKGIPEGAYVYFVHSYFARAEQESSIGAETEYGGETFPSVISRGNLFATQFHPEKSQATGLAIYRNFVDLVREARS
jgi:glutamine amidotransferase